MHLLFNFSNVPTSNFLLHNCSHYHFIGHCFFRSISSEHSAPSLPRTCMVLPFLTDPWHVLFLSLLFFAPLTAYSPFSSLFKPLVLKENIYDLLVLVRFSYYLLSHHYEPYLGGICHTGNFIVVYLLVTPSSAQLSCEAHESRGHVYCCSTFSFQCLAQCLAYSSLHCKD